MTSINKDLVEMKIRGLVIDPITRMPIIILHDENESDMVLPIWVGIFEANAIAIKIENIESPRPMTHDLLNNIITKFGYMVERIEINDLKNNTYFANIVVKTPDGGTETIDSRPSDAIALSIRSESPIFVNKSVLKKASKNASFSEDGKLNEEDIKKWFESLSPDLLNKYKM